MIKPIFDSMSVQPYSANATSVTTTSRGLNTDPNSVFEPRPVNPRPNTNDSDSFISEGPKIKLTQSKDLPVIYDNYKISSLISSLKLTLEKNKLVEHEICKVNEIEEILQSEGKYKVKKAHLQLLENLLEKYEHCGQDEILTNIIQALGLLVLKDDVIFLVCGHSVSKPVFKLAREFSRLESPDVQCAVVELFTNICSTDIGRGIFVAEEDPEEERPLNRLDGEKSGPELSLTANQNVETDGNELKTNTKRSPEDCERSNNKNGFVANHQTSSVDHRDVVQVTVKGLLADPKQLCEKAAALVYNISMAKVSEESALECASAILECLRKNGNEADPAYHCLFALKNFMNISPEVVNLTSVIGIDLPKFVKFSKKIEGICNELEQYLIV